MELHINTERGEVPVNEPNEAAAAEVLADAGLEIESENSQAKSAPSDNRVSATPLCVLDLKKTQCFVCYDIAKSKYSDRDRTTSKRSCPHRVQIPLLTLRSSARESDCQICHVFWGALAPFVESADEDVMTRAIIAIGEGSWSIDVIFLNEPPEPKSRITSYPKRYSVRRDRPKLVYAAHFFTPSGELQSWFSRIVPRSNRIQKHTNSAASHAIMRAWLSDCLQHHDNCKNVANTFKANVPDRLVHIVSKSCVRLSTRHSTNTPYLALSYCWGVLNVFSTTSDNLSEHMEGIPLSKLPKTFRHALAITQALGYEYIWIDSLCIIQGDGEDFAHQSGQMGDIYSNASVVLSADMAENVHEGFLHERAHSTIAIEIPLSKRIRHEHCQPPNESHPTGPGEPSRVTSYAVDDIETIFANPVFPTEDNWLLRVNPTFKRAWCLQEQLLARRVIHFWDNAMYWRCRVHSRCECGVTNRGNHLHLYRDLQSVGPLINYTNADEMCSMPLLQATEHWSTLVQEYSERKLTNPTDRLPAIAGLASRLQSSTLGEYHAGLWENSLPCALLWSSVRWIVTPEAHIFIGPTWSWVSSRSDVYMPGSHLIELATVIQVRTHLESSEKYGRIRAGWIRLSGLLREVNLIRERAWRYPYRYRSKRGQKRERLHLEVHWDSEYKGFPPPPDMLSDLYLLMIAKWGDDNYLHWEGLVLVKSRKQPGAFERVAVFRTEERARKNWKRKVVTII